jgi:hypothetical protein
MICDECETVAHCLKNGCVPKQPSTDELLKLALEFVEANHSGGQDAFELITAIKQTLSDATHLDETPSLAAPDPEERKRQSAPDPKDRRSAWVHATPWRGLTDDDVEECVKRCRSADGLARAIEAKLKEKNSD